MFNKCIGFILLQILSSKLIFGFPTGELKTMYEAVTEQCPNIEKTSLKDNEIFTKKCLNWAEINATSNLNETTKSNVECLVYYESLLSFCKDMGDTLLKVDGIIPLNSMLKQYTLDEVCHGNYTIYPANETVHNISSLIKNKVVCEIFCGTFTGTISDICAFAYYFTNFDVSKFSDKLKTLPNKNPDNSEPSNAQEAVEIKPVSVNKTNDDLLKNNQNKTASLASNSLNKTDLQPVIPPNFNNSKALLPKPEQSENIPNPNEIPSSVEIKHDEQSVLMQVDQKIKPVEEESVHTNNEPFLDKKGDAQENNGKKDSDQQPKASVDIKDGNQNKADPEKAEIEPEKEEADPEKEEADPQKGEADPEKSRKSENNIETPQQQGENPGDLNEDKNENVNDLYQEGFGMNEAEADQDDGNVKPEPVMPQDSEPKKVKPSTVEDEAVSSFNTQEDDMDGDSYFFSYFTVIMCLFIVGYVGYHNRQKVLALILEGKKGRRSGRSRRPNSANYHKLDTNLEEAISSSCKKNTSNVIY